MFGLFNKRKEDLPSNGIAAVVSGKIIPIEKVEDEVFSQKMIGDGVAILPEDDYVVSPCNGTISLIYPTFHAIGITSRDGMEMMIHIGIDTVNLQGKGFRSFVRQGQKINIGDKLVKVDFQRLKDNGVDVTTMLLFPGCDKKLKLKRDGYACKGKTIVATI